MADWLPRTHKGVIEMARKWNIVLPQKCQAWKIPLEDVTELNELTLNAEGAANQATQKDATTVLRSKAEEAVAPLRAKMRYIKRWLRQPPLLDSDMLSLGLKPEDKIKTAHIEVHEEVENSVHPDGIRALAVRFKVLGAAGKAKPDGYDGAVTIWHLSDKKPASPEGYAHHKMASRTPFRIEFKEEERGSKVWIQQCWQNRRGNTGRWSEALSAFVP